MIPRKRPTSNSSKKLATQALTQQLQQDEITRSAVLTSYKMRGRPGQSWRGAVVVTRSDPMVTYTYYLPDQKPAMLNSNVATCQHTYQCHADFDVRVEQGAAGQPFHFSIIKVRISLGLSCNIIEAKDPYDFIRLHEEQRRKIYEYFYNLGPQLANRIGEAVVGKEFTARESDFETVKARALGEAGALIQNLYLARLNSVARAADNYFENLTEHDLNDSIVNQAYQAAIDKFGKDFPN